MGVTRRDDRSSRAARGRRNPQIIVGRVALDVLAYFLEGLSSAISRRMARGQASGRGANRSGPGVGGESRNVGLMIPVADSQGVVHRV